MDKIIVGSLEYQHILKGDVIATDTSIAEHNARLTQLFQYVQDFEFLKSE